MTGNLILEKKNSRSWNPDEVYSLFVLIVTVMIKIMHFSLQNFLLQMLFPSSWHISCKELTALVLIIMAATSAGRKRRPWSTTIIGPHVACLRGSWGTPSAKGSIAGGYFAAQ